MVEQMIIAGLPIKEACNASCMSRGSWYRCRSGNETMIDGKTASYNADRVVISTEGGVGVGINLMVEEIKALIVKHPAWGYRRVHAHLKHRGRYCIGKKRVKRLMKENGLLARVKRFKVDRPLRSKPRALAPNEFWGTDMTKFLIPTLGWAYLVVVLDWFTKQIFGYAISLKGDTSLWLTALHGAVGTAFADGSSFGKCAKLISDNGSQPTSRRYIAECKELGIEQIFTTYYNPKGNADTERVIRTIKEESIWPYEFATFDEAKGQIENSIKFYNEQYCHSALSYQSPMEFLQAYYARQEQTQKKREEIEIKELPMAA